MVPSASQFKADMTEFGGRVLVRPSQCGSKTEKKQQPAEKQQCTQGTLLSCWTEFASREPLAS